MSKKDDKFSFLSTLIDSYEPETPAVSNQRLMIMMVNKDPAFLKALMVIAVTPLGQDGLIRRSDKDHAMFMVLMEFDQANGREWEKRNVPYSDVIKLFRKPIDAFIKATPDIAKHLGQDSMAELTYSHGKI